MGPDRDSGESFLFIFFTPPIMIIPIGKVLFDFAQQTQPLHRTFLPVPGKISPDSLRSQRWDAVDLFAYGNLEQAQEILEVQWQYRASRGLMAAHQLGIFHALRTPRRIQEIASLCATDPTFTEKLLIICCALGLVEKQQDRYHLTPLGRDLMLPESLRNIGSVLHYGEHLWWFWTGLADVVRTGRTESAPQAPEAFLRSAYLHGIWMMHGLASNGPAQWLARSVDLSSRSRLLDVGGGPGTFSIALCQKYRHLTAVIWDLPEVAAIAEENLKRYHMTDRIALQKGDWNTDDFGSGYDCLLMSNILHGPESNAQMKLSKAFNALIPGGLLIVHDFFLNDDRSGPLSAALFNMMVGAYTISEMMDEILVAGFINVQAISRDERRGSGIVTAIRPG